MPSLADKLKNPDDVLLLRELFYGAPKTRKTWLAGTAAEAGFNTILLDADHGYHILTKQLSDEAKKRLTLIECRDSLKSATASKFIARFLKQGKIWFNEKKRSIVLTQNNLDDDCIELNEETHLNRNTVLILDSYSAIVQSIKFSYAIEHQIDLTDPEKESWDGYAWSGMLASYILERLTKLPCHVIVIGHATQYEKRDKTGKNIEWQRRIIKSTSGPHAMTIADKFSDILYFYNVSASTTKIETRAEKDAEGGSRIIPPNVYKWEDLQFKDICKLAGIPLPPSDLPYLDFTPKISQSLTGGNKNVTQNKSTDKSDDKPAAITQKPKSITLGGLKKP